MSGAEKTPVEILAELEQQLAAKTLEIKGADPETARKIDDTKADLEYLGLVGKFNALGKQNQKYAIVDVTSHGKGFIVVAIGPKAEMHRKAVAALAKEDKLTDAKLLEIVRECVQHPALDTFDVLVAELPAVTDVCFLAVQDLWGARAKIRLEK
ncbi:MAG: hypothetical protein JWP97_5767 [Labilithrix sp.]|nr:hypothetical protein [Labilithrix sp.]